MIPAASSVALATPYEHASAATFSDRRHSERSVATQSVSLLPQNSCLFCGKQYRYAGAKRELLSKCVTQIAERSIKVAALSKADFKILGVVQDVDLIAKEARYHNTCRRDYVRRDDRQHHTRASEDDSEYRQQSPVAHDTAFQFLHDHIESTILQQGHVERMTMLLEKYQDLMHQHFEDYYSDSYNTQALKLKLLSHFGDR